MSLVLKDYKERVEKSVSPDKVYFSIERHNGYNYQFGLDVFSDPSMYSENLFIIERLIKTALWIAGGYKITILGVNKKRRSESANRLLPFAFILLSF